ncbi:galactose oxidase [Gigaspora margarita]|uniref:Galactose oxidase n=1 Tax=Gigaspora margarita TaxID=4874 RepID=A0A8H4B0D3_GIGMA|nr:galactose oxidase [Gigaspora margarita]
MTLKIPASDKRIIVFGGLNYLSLGLGDLWILNIESYQWSAGNISNSNGLTLWSHTANLVDNYMIDAFGTVDEPSQRIYMLDVSQNDSYKWVTEFTPSTTNTTNSSN